MSTNYRSNSEFGITDAVLHDVLPVLYLLEPEKFDVEVSCPETLLYASVKGAIESKEKQAGL